MMVRFLRTGLVLGLALAGFTGCEHHRCFFRNADNDSAVKQASAEKPADSMQSEISKVEPVDAEGSGKSFYQNSRRAGGLSSQAREIEGHFGIQ